MVSMVLQGMMVMDSSIFGVVEILLVFGVVLGLAIWQLWSVRREIARDKAEAVSPDKSDGASTAPGHAER